MRKTWWKEAVVYQVYPRSFMDANGDGIGDIKGIISKLDYIKELGADVVWLSPVYESPNDDNGYDVSDYTKIMQEFGDMDDWQRLAEGIHKRDMKVVMDMVLNHTSDEHEWFLQSRQSKTNRYRDYYYWRDGREGGEPNNWESFFGGSAWVHDEATNQYYLHLFSKKQPDLNWENPAVRQSMYAMMRFWLDKGVDGFRLDAVNLLSKRPDLPDSAIIVSGKKYAPCGHLNVNGPKIHDIFREMNREVFSQYDMFTVAEMAGVSPEEGLAYTDESRKELDSVIHFEHMDVDIGPEGKFHTIPFDLARFKTVLANWQTALHGKGWSGLYLNNHDQPRVVSRWGNDSQYRVESAKMFATCLHLLQGTPYIYQGEEIGMTNVRFDTIEDYRDVETRNYFQREAGEKRRSPDAVLGEIYLKSRDNARTPMQWDSSCNAGFSTGTPWISVNPNYREINVERDLAARDSIFRYYQKLIRLRKQHEVIVYGDFQLLLEEDPSIFVYRRTLANRVLLVMANFTDREQPAALAESPQERELLISNYVVQDHGLSTFTLRPYEARAYLWENV